MFFSFISVEDRVLLLEITGSLTTTLSHSAVTVVRRLKVTFSKTQIVIYFFVLYSIVKKPVEQVS